MQLNYCLIGFTQQEIRDKN